MNSYVIYVDDYGYISFYDNKVWWTLHHNGWEAFLPNADVPCVSTYGVTFPSDDDMGEAQEMYEKSL